MPGIALDLTPLRVYPDFRRLWTSSLITRLGAMATYVAAPFQIKALTGSYVAVGLLGLAELLPLVVFGLYGGALADRVDRVRMAILTELGMMACALILSVNALRAAPSLMTIYFVAMLMAAIDGLQRPSLDALLPRLVQPVHLPAASALNSLTHSGSVIVGTAAGGLIAVTWGPAAAYGIDTASYALSALMLLGITWRHRPPREPQSTWSDLVEGFRYALSRRDLLGTYLIDTVAMVFAFPNALFPFLADELGSPSSLGLLYAVGAIGSLVATATSGWTARVHRHGWAIIIAAATWGLCIAVAGMSHSLPIVLIALGAAGAADMVSGLFRSLMWNLTIPDELRGRLAGIELLSYSIGPQLGQFRASLSANAFGLQRALISGGMTCVVLVSATASALPQLRRFTNDVADSHK